jgi:hypothetical protein
VTPPPIPRNCLRLQVRDSGFMAGIRSSRQRGQGEAPRLPAGSARGPAQALRCDFLLRSSRHVSLSADVFSERLRRDLRNAVRPLRPCFALRLPREPDSHPYCVEVLGHPNRGDSRSPGSWNRDMSPAACDTRFHEGGESGGTPRAVPEGQVTMRAVGSGGR